MYRAVTRHIQVTVSPAYMEEQSAPEKNQYFWSYTVEIENLGDETVTLRTRHWHIRDASGAVKEVRGEGVIGKQPRLRPGERFEYTSGCPLETPEGIMSGAYGMETEEGETFSVEIPAFSLDTPNQRRVMH
ncbi:Co2+/Mg2+ efflux protein ApaG [Alsobacter soli]|uniref:Protein ApaG n=1 Tax=Alsobacter soli TaxID=2109933 RepID=A0A2T1HY95_9HYPH|nr:Co2+/Mg2+ efflux protein ApaG [Alsobacter soli]PSC06641.1 Co2+/Mg2+ efflux protein ApaG [Alsobacter soli]